MGEKTHAHACARTHTRARTRTHTHYRKNLKTWYGDWRVSLKGISNGVISARAGSIFWSITLSWKIQHELQRHLCICNFKDGILFLILNLGLDSSLASTGAFSVVVYFLSAGNTDKSLSRLLRSIETFSL